MATQLQRSAATRTRLLEATIGSLVEHGTQGSTTAGICRRAGVSKGAMLHHYPTKAALFAGAIEHLLSRRLTEFSARFARELDGEALSSEQLDVVVLALWEIYSGPTLSAWMELVVAARTDPSVREVMVGVNARFMAAAEVAFGQLFGIADGAEVRIAARLVMALFDGLALNLVLEGDPEVGATVTAAFRRLIEPWRLNGFGARP
jgi:AcrR family transcriptional regulator